MSMVNSKGLDRMREQLHELSIDRGVTNDGLRVYAAQCETAARLLREADPVVCNGLTEERPGWIDQQEENEDVLVLKIGIIPSTVHYIDKDGSLGA